MNRIGLKNASRQCLRDAEYSPRKVVLFYLCCLYLLLIPTDIYSYILQAEYSQLTGLAAIAVRKRYFLWTSVITVLINICVILWQVGFVSYTMRLSRRQRAGVEDLLTGFRLFGKILWLELSMAMRIFFWSLLFILPGIVAAYRYRMALFVLLDDTDASASRCLAESGLLTSGHKWEIFCLDLSFIWYYLLSSLCVSMPLLFTYELWPLTGISGYLSAYLIGVLGICIVDYFCFGYVQCTYAHCYNWLKMELASRYQSYNDSSI